MSRNAFYSEGQVAKNQPATLMARLPKGNGDAAQQADLVAGTLEYTAWLLDPEPDDFPDNRAAVSGHEGVGLTIGDKVFDSLQTGGLWGDTDSVGYNFLHTLDVDTLGQVFSIAGRYYLLEVKAKLAAGGWTFALFRLLCI